MVYLLGIKQGQHLEHFEPQPHRFEQLRKALNEPSLYDDVLAFLARRGFKIPAEVLRRRPKSTASVHPSRRDRIIPLRMECVALDIEGFHLRVADLDTL